MKHHVPHVRSLTLGIIATVIFICFRVWYVGSPQYLFLIWNIFLACLPFIVVLVLSSITLPRAVQYFLFTVWFLFLPNAPYVITDFIHLRYRTQDQYWIDVLMFFTSAIFSLLIGVVALEEGRKILRTISSRWFARLVTFLAIVLSGFGVYLGRFPRFNSWHLFTRPGDLVNSLYDHGITVLTQKEAFAFVAAFTFVFGLCYCLYKLSSKRGLE